jgi:hypothetical protein
MTSLLLLLLIALASLAGMAVSRYMPWSDQARHARLDAAVGIGIAPFVAGLAAVMALWVLPGQSHWVHALAVFSVLMAMAPVGWRVWARVGPNGGTGYAGKHWALAGLAFLAYVGAMVFDAAVVPLIQNDALEYATVGRILYDARSLSAYPAMDTAASASGFFGPWTHPPTYVSLIYLADVLQGQANSALALRIIAPWCLVAATLVVGAIGWQRSPTAGLVSAVLFVSSPILFLGATSALIDPLPVLAMALGFAGVVGLRMEQRGAAVAQGVLLGLGLWSHSQAILFPCLLLPVFWWVACKGDEPWPARLRSAAGQAVLALATAVLVGGAPYLRNVFIFGSPISDNPEVFAYGPLQFADYFRMQRGIADPVEIIQYGVFKGFFAIEAYSLTFWLALAGVPLALRVLWAGWRHGLAGSALGDRAVAAAMAVWLLYMAATALSAALGIDLMIRNERYLLVLMPCVALLAGVGLAGAGTGAGAGWRRVALVLLFALVPAQLFVLLSYRQSQLRGEMVAWDEEAQIHRWPPFAVMAYVRSKAPPTGVIFTMKPADMFYAGRRMLSYLDPRAIEFYKHPQDPAAATAVLRASGVTHLHMPDYFLPPVYMSTVMQIASDPQWSELVSEAEGYQIFALRSEPLAMPAPQALSVAGPWELQTHLVLGGRKTRSRIVMDRQAHALGQESVNPGFFGLFHRESARVWLSPQVALAPARQHCSAGAPELVLDVAFTGRAHAQLLALFTDAQGRSVERRAIGDRPALGRGQQTHIVRRMGLPPQATQVQLMFEHRGVSRLTLQQVQALVHCGPRQVAARVSE